MLGAELGRSGGGKQRPRAPTPSPGDDALHPRLAEGERAGLVEHDRVDAVQRLEDAAALDDAPRRAARPMAPRMASGVPAATPQAPATTSTEIDVLTSRQTSWVSDGEADARTDDLAGEAIGSACIGRARTLGALHRLDDLAVAGVGADTLGADLQDARTG